MLRTFRQCLQSQMKQFICMDANGQAHKLKSIRDMQSACAQMYGAVNTYRQRFEVLDSQVWHTSAQDLRELQKQAVCLEMLVDKEYERLSRLVTRIEQDRKWKNGYRSLDCAEDMGEV